MRYCGQQGRRKIAVQGVVNLYRNKGKRAILYDPLFKLHKADTLYSQIKMFISERQHYTIILYLHKISR